MFDDIIEMIETLLAEAAKLTHSSDVQAATTVLAGVKKIVVSAAATAASAETELNPPAAPAAS